MKLKLELSDGSVEEVEGTLDEVVAYKNKLTEQGVKFKVVTDGTSPKKGKVLLG